MNTKNPATTVTDHGFEAVEPFSEDCKHCDEKRGQHANRPDAFEEANTFDHSKPLDLAGARSMLDEIAQVIRKSADGEDHERLETLYQLVEAAKKASNPFTPSIVWTQALEAHGPEETPKAYLLGTVEISGIKFHVEAIQVKTKRKATNRHNQQSSVAEDCQDNLEKILDIVDDDAMLVKIGRRNYLIAITPHQL